VAAVRRLGLQRPHKSAPAPELPHDAKR
jgi:hypothetical protein